VGVVVFVGYSRISIGRGRRRGVGGVVRVGICGCRGVWVWGGACALSRTCFLSQYSQDFAVMRDGGVSGLVLWGGCRSEMSRHVWGWVGV